MKKLVVLFSSFPDFSGNSKALYEYMAREYKNNMRLVWVIYNIESKEILKKLNVEYVLFKSDEYEEVLNQTNIIFGTHGTLIPEKKEGQYYINLWHGVGPKKAGYLLDEKDLAPQDVKYYKVSRENTEYIIAPSELWRSVLSSLFDVDIIRVLSLGMPRCDYLFESNGKKNLQSLIDRDLNSYKKIIMYLPTFRKGCARENDGFLSVTNILNLKNYDEQELLDYLSKNNYLLVIKLHPSEQTKINKIDHPNVVYLDDNEMIKKAIIIYEIINCVDLLITDYSSIYIEYLLLNKPILFVHTDLNEYLDTRGFIFDVVDFWFPGPRINNLNDFCKETIKLITNSKYYDNERKKLLSLMFGNKEGNYCKSLCAFIFENNRISERCKLKINVELKLTNRIQSEEEKKQKLEEKLKKKEIEYENLDQKIKMILNSRSWKLATIIRNIKRKIFFFVK